MDIEFDGSRAGSAIYRKVPTKQVARLKRFRLTHPYERINVVCHEEELTDH